ncbi:ferritin-like domain-containing protein [Piscinibacter sakaiensis]|uniref:DUF2383 domain-containing protein n=1 Tax=Piscinibacter sakaiensis TaxID=1547922 RepID=A0A0K8P1I1_PISS1|nr:PA2169 family four-helix-bundle protein [Piscinibacter sakaiensis]GAP36522.1 hypothetical protein ISF6_2362 [Piscinibacter sakaiensis]
MNRELIDTLNHLVETCKDGEYGFTTCARHTESPALRERFAQRAADCRAAAGELQHLVFEHGGEPEDGGSALGALHRGWVAVLGAVAGSSDSRMLEEAERGEEAALERYQRALDGTLLPDGVRAVLQRQRLGVLSHRDELRALRERTPA